MQLRRVEVSNWRGVESATLEFGEGITIVGGRNESGKSTIRDALRSGYLLPQKGDKKSLEKKRPWGADVHPTVKIEFQIKGEKWEIQKELLRKKGWAELRHQGRLIAQDEQVQPRLFQELGARTEWIDTLWASQGDIIFTKPIPESVKGCLATAARDSVMPEVAELEKLILNNYSEFWTGQGRTNKAVQTIRLDAETKRNHADEASRQLKSAELAAEKIEGLKEEVQRLKAEQMNMQKQLESGKSSVQQWNLHRTAQSESKKLDTQHGQIKTCVDACSIAFEQLADLWSKSKLWQTQVNELRTALSSKPTDANISILKAKFDYVDALHRFEERLEVESIPAPNEQEMQELLKKENDLRDITANLKAGELKARLVAESDLKVTVQRDNNKEETLSLNKSDSQNFSAERAFQLNFPGIAMLHVDAGSQSTQQDLELRDELESDIRRALKDYNAESVSSLQERVIQKQAQLSAMDIVTDSTLRELESGVNDSDTLKLMSKVQRIDFLEKLRSEITALELTIKTLSEQFDAKQHELNDLMAKALPTELKTGLANQQTQVQLLKRLFEGVPYLTTKAKSIEQCDSCGAMLETLISNCDEALATANDQARSLLSYTESWKATLNELEIESKKLQNSVAKPEGDETTDEALNKLELEIQKSNQFIEQLDAELNQSIGTMSNQQPMYSLHVSALEALAAAVSKEEETNTNAQCIKMLKAAFDHAKRKLQEDVMLPLQSRVTARLRMLTDEYYRSASVNEALQIVAVTPPHVDSVEFDDISFGTKEQLTFLCRLSLAELLSESTERLTVILDDNLVHSDGERMSRLCRMLEEASKNVQIIIFTCHPDRYDQIKDKTVLNLVRSDDKENKQNG